MRYATLALTALFLVSCNRDPNVLKQEYLKRGNDFFKAGKYKQADIYYRKAIEKDRKFGEAYYRLALAYIKENAGVNAIRPLHIAVELLKKGSDSSNDAIMTLAEIEVAAAGAIEKNEQLIKEIRGYSDELLKANPNSWGGHKLAGDLAFLDVKKEYVDQKVVEAKKSLETAITEYRTSLAAKGDEYPTQIAPWGARLKSAATPRKPRRFSPRSPTRTRRTPPPTWISTNCFWPSGNCPKRKLC